MQTMLPLIRRHVPRRLIWVYTVCQCPFKGTLGINGLTFDYIVFFKATELRMFLYCFTSISGTVQQERFDFAARVFLIHINGSCEQKIRMKSSIKDELSQQTYNVLERFFRLYWVTCITKTCLYNYDPLKPHFYTVKLGFTGVYIIFLISAQKHRLWVRVRTASPRRF